MNCFFTNKKGDDEMSESADIIYRELCESVDLEIKKEEQILRDNIEKGLIIEGNMYLNIDTGEIKINEKYIITPLMSSDDISNNLIELLEEQSKEELKQNEPSFLKLKTINENDFSINLELCLYGNRLKKIRMNVVATMLKDLLLTERYTLEHRLEHLLNYLEKFIQVDFIEDVIKRDRIIFKKGIINIIKDDRISDVKILIDYNI